MSENEINPEVVEQLKASEKLRGPHDKVVLSADGKTIADGHQRKAADPDWPEEINPALKTEKDIILFSIDKNWHRTNKTENWKRDMIERLARMGDSPKLVTEETGLPDYTVWRYYPDELKNRVKADAGKVGGEVTGEQRSAYNVQAQSQDLRQAEEEARAVHEECANCHMGLPQEEFEYIDGKPYCHRCAPFEHIAFEREKKRLEQQEKNKEKPVSPKQLDSWEQRKANMSPHDSQFQQEVFVELANEGYLFEQNVKLPVFETEPDGLEQTLGLLVYLDSTEVHKGSRLDKDEQLRGTYQKHHPTVTILAIPFNGKSEKEKARVKGLIREKYDFLREELQKWPSVGKEANTLPGAADDKEES